MSDIKPNRTMVLSLSVNGAGYAPGTGPAAAGIDPPAWLDRNFYKKLAASVEKAKFDFILIDDLPGFNGYAAEQLTTAASIRPESVSVAGMLVPFTEHVGIAATIPITFNEPYHISRKLASLDHLSKGRAAWNIAFNSGDAAERHFGRERLKGLEEQQEQAEEFLGLTDKLWDSWEDDSLIIDKESGIYADPDKHHPLQFKGRYYSVKGALNVLRPPQGHPIKLTRADSPFGLRFAAEHADIVFGGAQSIDEAKQANAVVKQVAKAVSVTGDQKLFLLNVMLIQGDTEQEANRQAKLLEALFADSSVNSQGLGIGGWLTVAGTPAQIADELERWYLSGSCDGFNFIPPLLPESVDAWADGIIRELQIRGLHRTEYEDATLRERLGLTRPGNQFGREAGQ
ncbi:LLM class flavin-dependent oxidoreductase [Paenibacillus sp. NPDC058071]|uniref:LLM class flavin-dependent oxidoreductase n=1 Tax=Paenibacillus sp. NPDC058071 TaxID=3346326 RepID=UPI0036D95199